MDFKVITLDNSQEWKHILSLVKTYDFYHTPSYHQLEKSGEPRLLVFQEKDNVMALPLIVRKIDATPWFDVTSVYGYAGWISSQNVNASEVSEILQDYFEKEKIISAFSRIHPLIENADSFPVGIVEDSNLTLGINLKEDPAIQKWHYSRSVRSSINKSRKSGIQIRMSKSMEDVRLFSTIYTDAMHRLKAPEYLFFTSEYFESLIQSTDFDAFILFAELSGITIGGAIFVSCNDIMEYHLGATVDPHRQYSPLKLLIDEARLIGNEKKMSVLHLGGGYGGENDNLYVFKQRMSSLTYTFKVWKWIVNEEAYRELSFGKNPTNYFPLYRS
jgi:hypothetical protein